MSYSHLRFFKYVCVVYIHLYRERILCPCDVHIKKLKHWDIYTYKHAN